MFWAKKNICENYLLMSSAAFPSLFHRFSTNRGE